MLASSSSGFKPRPSGGTGNMVSNGFGGKSDHGKKKRGNDGENSQHPGHEVVMAVAIGPGDQGREDNKNPLPEHERAFQGSPQAGDPVIDRSGAGGIEGDVFDGEIHGHKGVNQRQGGDSDEHKLPQNRPSGTGEENFATAARAENRRRDSPQGED